ncbi:MAG: methyltransferase domain-containing protein [Elusimicrobia bacterium]|nr:methyltransferase domain-containing protein [Elusimicrobiota bacterium]
MTKGAIKLDEDVRAALNAADIFRHTSSWGLRLTEQLDRPTYTKVNKILEVAGGKWNRGAKAHLFSSDPREILGLAVSTGEVVDKKRSLGQFFTNAALAGEVAILAGITERDTVLEPSAGGGSLALAVREKFNVDPVCVEIDSHYCDVLREYAFAVINEDFLKLRTEIGQFDVVIMNPPFLGNEYIKHILRAYREFLKPGGRLVAIAPSGAVTGTTKLHRELRQVIEQSELVLDDSPAVRALPPGTFTDEGTEVRTVLIRVTKPVL